MSDLIATDQPLADDGQPAQDPGPLPKRMLDTLFSPVALFRRFHTRAPWADVLFLSAALTAALTLLIPRGLIETQIREEMSRNPLPAGAAAPSMETMVAIGRIGGALGQLVGTPLVALLTAGLATLVFGRLMGGGGSFRKHLAVASHAALVGLLGFAVTLFFMIRSGDMATQLSLALLVPGLEAGTFAFRLLNALNVFVLWSLGLIAGGAYAVNRRISPAVATGVTFGLYLAVAAGIAALRG